MNVPNFENQQLSCLVLLELHPNIVSWNEDNYKKHDWL